MAQGARCFWFPKRPIPPTAEARCGPLRFWYLSPRYDVDVIVFREPGSPDPAPLFPAAASSLDILVLALPPHRKDPISRAVRNAERMARAVPPLVDRFSGFAAPISGFLTGRQYDVAVIEHLWCAAYLEQIAPVSRRTVLNLHNIESVLHQRCAVTENGAQAFAHRIFAGAARDLEACWLPRYNQVLTTSAEDEKIARAIAPGVNTSVYPNAIPFVPRPSGAERESVAFSGNLEYHPNVAAVRYFRQEIWPALRERWPSIIWQLIGRNSGAVRRKMNGDSRIVFSGPVANAVGLLATAKVVVVPLLAGSGTRFKLLEAWAAGRAIVSTTIGAEGLPARHGKNLLIADDAGTFADSVSRLLTCPDLRMQLGETGRALFESEFTWDNAWQKLDL